MSFWDHLKPAVRTPNPTELALAEDNRALRIVWDDGQKSDLSAQTLRRRCPCATCIDEWTHRQTLDVASVPESIRVEALSAVGNYALGLQFSDGHRTGIYPWPLLREISESLLTGSSPAPP